MTERPLIAVLILAVGLVSVAVATLWAYPRTEAYDASLPRVVTGLPVTSPVAPGGADDHSPPLQRWPVASKGSGPRLLTYGDMNEIGRRPTREVVLPLLREEQSRDGSSEEDR